MGYVIGRFWLWFLLAILLLMFGWVCLILFKKFVRVLRELNNEVKKNEKDRQTVATAKADAEAMRIKTEALKQSKSLVELEAVKKWNGVLPQFIFGGGTTPFIDISKLGKNSRTE